MTPDFPAGTLSLELLTTGPVRLDPVDTGKRIGTIAIDTRVGWTRTATGKGCTKLWVEIRPRGWVCGDNMRPSTKLPFGREVPLLDRGEIVPGIYGRVTGKNNNVTYTLQKPEPPKKPAKGAPKKTAKATGPVTSPSQLAAPKAPEPKIIEDKPILGTLTVRQYEELTVGGKVYWRISQKGIEYVL